MHDNTTSTANLLWHRRGIAHLRRFAGENASVAKEFARENLRRLRIAALAVLMVNLVHVLVFGLMPTPADPLQERWRSAVFATHLVMAAVFSLLGLLADRRLRRPPHAGWDQTLGICAVVGSVLFAGVLTVIDQWVTPSITPFLIGSTAVSTVFLIRPLRALVLFGGLAALVIFGLPLTQANPSILLSNQMNVLTAAVLTLSLAILLWRQNTGYVLLQRALSLSHETLKQKQSEVEALARIDPLTGLNNRREFTRLAGMELTRAARQVIPTAFIMVDLDFFKQVNDTYGHPVGDEVLKNVARVLANGVRESDLVSRFGGEEMMLLLPATDEAGAITLADRLRARLAQTPVHWNGRMITITASFGVAVVPAETGATLLQAYIAVDEALYKAKRRGRDRVESAPLRTLDPTSSPKQGSDRVSR